MASCPRLQQLLMLACIISLALTLTPETSIPVRTAGVYVGRKYETENKIKDGNWTICSVHSGKSWVIEFENNTVSWVRVVGTSWKVLPNMTVVYSQPPRREQVHGSSYVLDWVSVRGVTTRYVRLRFPSPVTLCEVEINKGPMLNVALGKPASQSSTFDGTDIYQKPPLTYRASADLAVDGAPTKAYSDKTCAVTEWLNGTTDYPWWQVDLGDLYNIFLVNIYGRREKDKPNYGPLVVRVGSHVERPENRTLYSYRPLVSVPLSPPVTASTVNISIDNTDTVLQLCEVEVYAVSWTSETQVPPKNTVTTRVSPPPTPTDKDSREDEEEHKDIDQRASPPCHNEGQCTDEVNSYTCTCLPGYTAVACDKGTSGTQVPPKNTVTTRVSPPPTPTHKDSREDEEEHKDIDECARSPCHNGSTCTDGVNSYTCTCLPGYTGVTCDNVLDTNKAQASGELAGIAAAVSITLVIVIATIVIVKLCWRRGVRKCAGHRGLAAALGENGGSHVTVTQESDVYYNTTSANVTSTTRIMSEQLPVKVAAVRTNRNFFHDEYLRLPKGLQHPHSVATSQHNREKNRYKNVCAYDHSRVVLSVLPGLVHSDYINASYMDGFRKSNAFIAAQGPTDTTVTDFIRMICEKNIHKVVMVTKPTEGNKVKCVQYWDDRRELTFETFKVKVVEVTERKNLNVRRLAIKPAEGEVIHVTHFLYTTWPDKEVPESPWPLVDFRDKIMASGYETTPILIHCSAGVGRTGTLIALDVMLRQLAEEGAVDVYNTVWALRQHRVDMVQTRDQYTFLHEAALVGLCSAGRVIPLQSFTSDPVANDKALIEKEFKALTVCTSELSDEACSLAKMAENHSANRNQDIIPPDDLAVWLREQVPGQSDYFNAVFVPSYEEERRYILTQTPLPNTVVNFWRAVLEFNVKAIVTLDRIKPDVQGGVEEYVPQGQSPATFGPLTLSPLQKERNQGYTVSTLDVAMNGCAPKRVQQFVVSMWSDNFCVPPSADLMVSLARAVLNWTPPKTGAILVHCRDGASRSGLYVALSTLLERSGSDSEVAVPYVVGVLKSVRPQALPNKEQYAFLYDAMLGHVESALTYENFPRSQSSPDNEGKQGGVYSNDD